MKGPKKRRTLQPRSRRQRPFGDFPNPRSTQTNHPRKRSRPGSISRAIEVHSGAVSRIGRGRLRPGTHLIGRTRYVTPTKRGLAVVREIEKAIKRVKDPVTFSYALQIKGPDGKVVRIVPANNILPRSERERHLESELEKGKLTKTKYTRELLDERIRSEVFRSHEWPQGTSETFHRLAVKSPAAARRYLQKVIRQTGVTFRVEVFREL
jgi:hypothetical protein